MTKTVKVLLNVAVLGLACSAGALVMLAMNRPGQAGQVGAERIPVAEMGLRVLPFELTDHEGRPADRSALEGQWTLVSFIFTNCPGACPVMTARMAEVQRALPGSTLRFAGFSLDAQRDTPEKLRAFAAEYGLDLGRWTLLTGDDAQVRRMVEEGLLLVIDKETTAEITLADGSTMRNITHPTRLFLVGPDLRVMEMYESGNPAELERIAADVARYTGSE